MTIEDLEQLRLLSDPLKLSLAQVFGEAEGTVASAAEALGEPQTKLYRHVDALLDAGLIEVTREQPKRGTVERWFRTVARRFEVADGLLTGEGASDDENTVRDLLRSAEAELLQALREEDEAVPPTFARFRARLTAEQLKELQDRLFVWLDEMEEEPQDGEESIEVGALIALYRLPRG
jgi:DNA-binding transcriptional ArsR family regulator